MDLTLHKIYFVEGPENFQPSGLTMIDGDLYTVSDKHDAFIYHLSLSGSSALAVPAIEIARPCFSFLYAYDFEGISHDAAGNFYLASESQRRIMRISPKGEPAEWITPDLKSAGEKYGLFQTRNAYLEGICNIPPETVMVCAERQNRGLLEINLATSPLQIAACQSENSIYRFPEGIRKDFSGLSYFRNTVYVLERNAYLFSALKRVNGHLIETRGWSYRHIETAAPYAYADMTHGKAEGLYIDDQYIYIILDNNNIHRAGNPNDRRPLLMIFDHPDGF